MASIKIVLRKKIDKDGRYPLCIRITKDRKSSFITLDYHIKEAEWDAKEQRVKKSHPNSARLNNYLLKKLAETTEKSLELETTKDEVSSDLVKQQLKPRGGSSFFKQADLYIDDLKKSGKYNRYTPDKSRIATFRNYLKNDIAFSDINVALLEKFKVHLRNTTKLSERSIVNHMAVIRSVFSYAIKANVTDKKYYPFGEGMIKIKFPESLKVGLSIEEIQRLEDIKLPKQSVENHARNLFLFSFYFAGMRISDVLRLRWTDFQNDRLYYSMGKNAKSGSLKVPEKALKILSEYKLSKTNEQDLVFPDLNAIIDWNNKFVVQRTIAYSISKLDKILMKNVAPKIALNKKLTMHIARHTFGNLSGDKIPIQMLQKLYRHSNVSTTIGYQSNFIHKEADDALDTVINSIESIRKISNQEN